MGWNMGPKLYLPGNRIIPIWNGEPEDISYRYASSAWMLDMEGRRCSVSSPSSPSNDWQSPWLYALRLTSFDEGYPKQNQKSVPQNSLIIIIIFLTPSAAARTGHLEPAPDVRIESQCPSGQLAARLYGLQVQLLGTKFLDVHLFGTHFRSTGKS